MTDVPTGVVQSVSRALLLLELLAQAGGRLPISDLAAHHRRVTSRFRIAENDLPSTLGGQGASPSECIHLDAP